MAINYDELSDEEIIKCIGNKDDDAIEYMIKKYGYIVKRETRTVYIIGADDEDLTQEGMIGLFKAIRDYEVGKGTIFSTFATLCVRRQLQTAITNSNRKKHAPLNDYLSIYADNDNSAETIQSSNMKGTNPEDIVLQNESLSFLIEKIKTSLSKFENTVLELFIEGKSYKEIAEELGKTEKSIDNALQRIRAKLM